MLDRAPLKRKLAAIHLAVTALALTLVGVAVLFDQYRVMKTEMLDELRMLARIVAEHSTAAVQFEDPRMADEILAALKASPNIRHAAILDASGKLFAEFRRAEDPDTPLHDNLVDGQGAREALLEPIQLKGERIGELRIAIDLAPLRDFRTRQIAIVLAILAAVFAIVWATLDRLHRTLTAPLHKLSELMRLVSEKQAYSLRAEITSQDEVGALAQGFNEMLEQIQKRDRELQEHRLGLERLVGRRTEQLEHMATHDALTGLPNRQLFMDRLVQAICHAERAGSLVAVVFVDLDHFKDINDTLGHGAGDQLLRELSTRELGTLRKGDTVARFGGDEFVLLLVGLKKPDDVEPEVERIQRLISMPVSIGDFEARVSASIGISIYPQDGDNGEVLLRNADTAMYRAKELGRANYQFYTEELNTRLVERLRLQAELRQAIEEGQFVLYYQPQVELQSGAIVGAEALVRWQHPQRGLVTPGHFIAQAEESGLIVSIGEWVLHEACRQAAAWRHAGWTDLRVSVNLSVVQFRHCDIVDLVTRVLQETGLPAQGLELELTESILLEEADTATDTLSRLKVAGVGLSIDDFGTGYSSLSYLKRLTVDKLKVDRSFVRDLTEDPEDAAIIHAVVQLGHTLRLRVIAEGVETEGQLAFLRRVGCDEIQGYLFSPPLPPAEFETLARVWRLPTEG